MQKKEKTLCPCCGASMAIHNHRLSKGLIISLVKFRKAVIENNCNEIHVQSKLKFTYSEYCNFQKLRYHGLIAKVKDKETGERKFGVWLLTRRGNQFCKSEITLPESVSTFRNRIVERSIAKVSISYILKDDMPYWDKIENFTGNFPEVEDIKQQSLI
jgi:hypothetical protein